MTLKIIVSIWAIGLFTSGMCVAGGNDGDDFAIALRNWKPAVQGDGRAQYILGVMYDHDAWGVPQDYNEAVVWFRKAAEQGDVRAQYVLGKSFSFWGNFREAATWYRKAADHGDAKAQFSLGWMYDNGWGVPLSYKEALVWYRKAATQWNLSALNSLGQMYANGHGVPQMNVVAYALFNLSLSTGGYPDTNSRDILAKDMSNKAIEAGQELSLQMMKSGNMLRALDQYVKHQTIQ